MRKRYRFLIFKIGDDEVEVERVGERGETFEDFKMALPFTDARYGIFDQDYLTHDGRPASKIWFVSWLPSNSTVSSIYI